ncbi:hypothetical protein [Streptomyces sp. ISL-36]|uniref:hypothetical protein n=1 Tax=Streptomyces sp. ISL-36 TaxID=2819182 RepID=UPI002034F873|nr:hypothetical protein [Streptomyces sp. ISL-36]
MSDGSDGSDGTDDDTDSDTTGTGAVSRLADGIESVQLGMAGELLGHADDLLADRRVTSGELRYLAGRLTESLRDVKRIAESRGARLGV